MNDTYVECLVRSKQPAWGKALRVFMIILAVFFVVFIFIGMAQFWGFIAAIVAGIGAWAVNRFTKVEYEYLYLDREITIDAIMNQVKRKKVASFDVSKIEAFAPIKSYHLDNFRNRQCKTVDYSLKTKQEPDERYIMYYEGNQKIIMNPSEEFVKALKNVNPRKVFSE